jgi:hypothetical protein
MFHNHAAFAALYPDHAACQAPVPLCAARLLRGEALATAISPVVARAAAGVVPGRLRGALEKIEAGQIVSGWALDESHPELPLLLEVLVEEQVIGTVLACAPREDRRLPGLPPTRCAFSFNAPARLRPEQISSLRIRRAADGAELDDGARRRDAGGGFIGRRFATGRLKRAVRGFDPASILST